MMTREGRYGSACQLIAHQPACCWQASRVVTAVVVGVRRSQLKFVLRCLHCCYIYLVSTRGLHFLLSYFNMLVLFFLRDC